MSFISIDDLYKNSRVRITNLGKKFVKHHYDVVRDVLNEEEDGDSEDNL